MTLQEQSEQVLYTNVSWCHEPIFVYVHLLLMNICIIHFRSIFSHDALLQPHWKSDDGDSM